MQPHDPPGRPSVSRLARQANERPAGRQTGTQARILAAATFACTVALMLAGTAWVVVFVLAHMPHR